MVGPCGGLEDMRHKGVSVECLSSGASRGSAASAQAYVGIHSVLQQGSVVCQSLQGTPTHRHGAHTPRGARAQRSRLSLDALPAHASRHLTPRMPLQMRRRLVALVEVAKPLLRVAAHLRMWGGKGCLAVADARQGWHMCHVA